MLAAGPAFADPTLLVPGHSDNGGQFYVSELQRTGQLPGDNRVVAYPADIWPLDPLRMDDATNIGADEATRIYDSLRPDQRDDLTCRAFSEGTAVCLKLAERRNVPHVVLDGDPYGSTGLFNNPLVQVVQPIVGAVGVPTDLPVPAGTVRNYNQMDEFGNGGPQNPLGLITQLVDGPGHSVQDPNAPHNTWVGPNGEINNEFIAPPQWMPIESNIPAPPAPDVPVPPGM